jgi:hypothetical protein
MNINFSLYVRELQTLLHDAEGTWLGRALSLVETVDLWVTETRKAAEADRRFFFIGNGASATSAYAYLYDHIFQNFPRKSEINDSG